MILMEETALGLSFRVAGRASGPEKMSPNKVLKLDKGQLINQAVKKADTPAKQSYRPRAESW